MRVTVTGATGRIGRRIVATLKDRGDEVTVLSRDPGRAGGQLGVEAFAWNPKEEAAPPGALAGRDAIVHLAGEDVGQRWSAAVKAEILDSREHGTRNLVESILAAQPPPAALIGASASGYYGAHDDEVVDESAGPGGDWLAQVVARWERETNAAGAAVRTVVVRTGIVLDAGGGALKKMLPPFKAGIGGPVGGGSQYVPWIHLDDLVGIYVAAIDNPAFRGPVNASAPEPVTNKAFSEALGRAIHRPAIMPVPGLAVRLLYGEMSQIVLTGVRMVPGRVGQLGYEFEHPDLDEALRSTLG